MKAMTPIIDLTKGAWTRTVSLEALDALDELGVTGDDELTYTMRISVVPEKVDVVRKQLEARLSPDDFKVLVEILDETEWDCSFLVDCF